MVIMSAKASRAHFCVASISAGISSTNVVPVPLVAFVNPLKLSGGNEILPCATDVPPLVCASKYN